MPTDIITALNYGIIGSGIDSLDQSMPEPPHNNMTELLDTMALKAFREGALMAITMTIPPKMKHKNRILSNMPVDKQYKKFLCIVKDVIDEYNKRIDKEIGYEVRFECHKNGKVHCHIALCATGLHMHPYYVQLYKDISVKRGFVKYGLDVDYCRHPVEWLKYIRKERGMHPMYPLLKLLNYAL